MRSKRSGVTLVTAIVFSVIIAIIMSVVGTLVVSHYARATVEGDYADALNIAEAGLNYEIRWISLDTTDPTRPHQKVEDIALGLPGPYTGSIPGVPGSYTVFVTQYDPDDPTGPGFSPWQSPNDFLLTSIGTVNGIERAVRIRGVRKSIFDEYALYAIDEGTFGGAGAASGATRIYGSIGTNGQFTFNGAAGTNTIVGSVEYNGTPISENGSNVYTNPDPVEFPTITEIADAMFIGGLVYLQTGNNNANIKMLDAADPSLLAILAPGTLTLDDLNLVEVPNPSAKNPATMNYIPGTNASPLLIPAGYDATTRLFTDPDNTVIASTCALDDGTTGTRYITRRMDVVDGVETWFEPIEGCLGQRTYFLPPGDYYFHNIDWKSGTAAFVVLSHLGPVRIWIDEGGSGGGMDWLQTVVIFTTTDPSKFRLFYNKCNTLNIAGNSNFYGGFYAVKDGCPAGTPELKFTGNTTIYGSVIAQNFTLGGGTRVIFPSDGGGSDPTDFALWFGFKDGWKEISPTNSPEVFADGTSR